MDKLRRFINMLQDYEVAYGLGSLMDKYGFDPSDFTDEEFDMLDQLYSYYQVTDEYVMGTVVNRVDALIAKLGSLLWKLMEEG